MRLSVVVPCFNEEQTVERLADALRHELGSVTTDFEIVLVDDGSGDGTLEAMRRVRWADPRFGYVALSRNFGKDAAILAGLSRTAGDAVAIMDADLQHPPELLAEMLNVLDSGFDQVVARRDREGEALLRRWFSRLYYRLANRIVDVDLVDGVGDFRMLSRRAVDALLSLGEYNRFSKGLFAWIGFDTATITQRNAPRQWGSSKFTPGKLINHGIDGIISFNHKPLRVAIYAGVVVMLLSFGYAADVLVNSVIAGVDVPGYTTLMTGVAGLGGLQLMLLGVSGEYLGRIYYETKRRPHFLVKETSENTEAATSLVQDGQDIAPLEASVRK